jgi:hypothetical protein
MPSPVPPALVPAGKRLQVPDDVADAARAVGIFLKTGSHLATHTTIELFRMVADIPP